MLNWLKNKIANKDAETSASVATPSSRQTSAVLTIKGQGDEHLRAGQYAEAEHFYRQVAHSDKEYPGSLVGLGFVLNEQGRTQEARQVLERSVDVSADDADSHYLLATVLAADVTVGQIDREVSHLRRAIELRSDFEMARLQLITALFKSDRFAEATESCEAALSKLPQSAALHFYRSNLHVQAGEKLLALTACKLALSLDPGLIAAQQSLSRLLVEADQLDLAEASYRREIELTPEHFGPYHQLGALLTRLLRHTEAIELFKRAILLNPSSSASYSSIASAYTDLDGNSEANLTLAQEYLAKAIALDPENWLLYFSLGMNHWLCGQVTLSLASFDRAIELNPNEVKVRWARVMLWAPVFPNYTDDSPHRARFGAELAQFRDWWFKSGTDGATFVGELQPFFLSYQEDNNLGLLKQYGEICALAMERWLNTQAAPALVRPKQDRIRLGVVSADIRIHSIWTALIQGWFQSLDHTRFELIVFSLSELTDHATAWARTQSDVFVGGPKRLDQWVTAIREQNCEMLLYPAVGLDPMTLKLASLRLARVQMNAWGHPDTSGLPTLDYYLSADCFEPANAENHYSERLVKMPALGNRLQPLATPSCDLDFTALDISLERPIIICAGTPFKYQPIYDHIFTQIARRLPDAQLIFFLPVGQALGNRLRVRFIKSFETAGLNIADHVKFIGWLTFPAFHSLLKRADIMLDTIGFSGYNTAVQALECGLPIATREGRFLRGRLASGVLRRIEINELIAQNEIDYVNLIVRLIRDLEFRENIRKKIVNRRSVLFDDLSAMGPLQDFLASVARPEGQVVGQIR